MAVSKSGVPVYADTAALSRLSRSLRQASPAAWKAYRVAVRAAAEPLLADMQSRAIRPKSGGQSTRIPQSGSVKVTAGGNVKIVFTAPDAAPIENAGKGFVRHPTFGRRGKGDWTDKNSPPPFAAPALAAHEAQIAAAVERAVTDAVGRVLGA